MEGLNSAAATTTQAWVRPLPIAWLTVKTETGNVLEGASCYFNGCADGGTAPNGPGPRAQPYIPCFAVGLRQGQIAGSIRHSKEVVIHTATWPHRRRIQQALISTEADTSMEIPQNELCPAVGKVSVPRIAIAPIAFSCSLTREVFIADGRVAFIFSVVGVHVLGSLVVEGCINSQALQAIAACEPSGSVLLQAREEHTMPFPETQDAQGAWIVPESRPTSPIEGRCLMEDLSYEPPLLPNLEHNPFKALIVPRPIGWISTRGVNGDNLSPYSFFGYLAPDVVFYGAGGAHVDGGEKDALQDARNSGVFCMNVVPWALRMAMSASSAEVPHGTDEFKLHIAAECQVEGVKVVKADCKCIDAPCVGNAPFHLECKVIELITLTDNYDVVVVGKVVHTEGHVDIPVAARGGHFNYFRVADEHAFIPSDETAVWDPA